MKNLEVNYRGNFELSMQGPEGQERIKVKSKYPDTGLSRFLFTNLGLMHMIAPYLPHKISPNFWIASQMKDLIAAMYKSENLNPPLVHALDGLGFPFLNADSKKVAVAYSAGKDSMWNLWWAREKYGPENVLAVHIRGLNRGQTSEEFEYAKKQQKKIGFELETIELLNGSRNSGFEVMRSRDMFLAGIIIPVAIEWGASKVIIEGFAEADPREMFTGQEKNMKYFNEILASLGIPVQVDWRSDRKEMDAVKDLLVHQPDWLSHVCNCFSNPAYKIFLRKSWVNRTPRLARIFYDSQCGSCVKCRIINIVRILYDSKMGRIPKQEIHTYLKNTAQWIKKKYPTHADMIEGSFLDYFNQAVEKYNLNNLKSVR